MLIEVAGLLGEADSSQHLLIFSELPMSIRSVSKIFTVYFYGAVSEAMPSASTDRWLIFELFLRLRFFFKERLQWPVCKKVCTFHQLSEKKNIINTLKKGIKT